MSEPATAPVITTGLIHRNLDRMLASKLFQSAPEQAGLLEELVEHTLAGYPLNAPDLEGSRPDIRATAARLRELMDEYYTGPGRRDELRIEIPRGEYHAVFLPLNLRLRRDYSGPMVVVSLMGFTFLMLCFFAFRYWLEHHAK